MATGAFMAGCFSLSLEAEEIDFNRQIRPILSENCFACHGPDANHREGDLRLDTFEGATEAHDGTRAVDVKNPLASSLLARIGTKDQDDLMPPLKSHKRLTTEDKALLKRWIEGGANWAEHWAFVPAKVSAGKHNIDSFIKRRLQEAKLKPSSEADRETLIRRVTFDLTGLPPTLAEVKAFLTDKKPDAYDRVVDRLLASKAYGERMTLAWMDMARYGDSSVMHADGPRSMWPWRDWVINAYNDNKPFDQFTIEQLAGDLLPNASLDQKIATGFNRNHATSDEGGAISEELRVEYIVDRVQTTSNVWMGLTMECGQCHDHKFDPITQREYYQLFAYFNNNADPGMQSRKGNQAPVAAFFSPDQKVEKAKVEKDLAVAKDKLATRRTEAIKGFAVWHGKARGDGGATSTVGPKNLVMHFPLDGTKGQQISERVTGRKAKIKGKLASVKRGDGEAGVKLGGGNSATFEDPAVLEYNQSLSFAAWVKIPKKNTSGAIFARMDEANKHRGYDMWLQGNRIGAHLIHEWPKNAVKVVTVAPLKHAQWHHVCITYDGSGKAKGMEIWVDGKKVKTKTESDGLTASITPKVPLKIGGRSGSSVAACEIDDLRIYQQVLSEAEVQSLGKNPVDAILALAPDKRKPEQQKKLEEYFLTNNDAAYKDLTTEKNKVATALKKIEDAKLSSMIMADNDAKKKRQTYVLTRGAYASPDKEQPVEPGVPAALPPLPADAPANRLGLAQWLMQSEHPLTARVAVNRYWMMFFGTGLVKSVSDFGSQGEPPSHPELLDWLATDFTANGWNVKRTIKQIVMSAAYRQQSQVTPESIERDPQNRLLARGSRFRLQGEFIRDNALAVSGLLVGKVGGPSVKPYQPPGLWNEVALSANVKFVQDKGDKIYRRSMYTYWKRSAPQPAMMAFDAPTREKCVIQRQQTNTPMQALVTLNDPQFVEASRALAERMMSEGGKDFRGRLNLGYRLLLGREVRSSEVVVLDAIFREQLKEFRAEPDKAKKLLEVGDSKRNETLDPAEHAAWTVLGNLMLNLDEVLIRG
ncbi:MAG: DUF1553 domain-containing protein [Verrucomicrobia bacterium]|nr:DUF1553 domain-containing protein [Verrucomicrobiota bacterium]